MECMDNALDWNALEDISADEDHQEKIRETEAANDEHLTAIMYHLVNDNKEAFEYLKNRFMDTAMAVPGDDMLTIGLRQGSANMLKWIMNKADENKV